MSAIPQAVRRATERSNQLIQEFHQNRNAPPAANVNTEVVPTDTPAPAAPVTTAQPPTPVAVVPPVAAPVQPAGSATIDWEQRYRVVEGKYRAEVPRLKQQIQDLQDELRTLKDLLASRVVQPAASAPAASAQPAQRVKLVTPEEEKEWGPDLLGMVRKVVQEESQSITAEVDRRIAPVQQRIDRVAGAVQDTTKAVEKKSREAVFDALDAQVQNWTAMNDDPLFNEWLEQVDPFSGQQRGTLLKQAFEAHDAPRVVAFFTGYLSEHATVSPPATPQPTPAPATPAPAGTQVTLESLVAPGTPNAGAPRTPDGSEKRIYTHAQVKDFYELKRRNKTGLTPQQIAAVDADIFAAGREGRIR